MESNFNYNELLDLAAELGCRLMSSGAEIYRVEESMHRLLAAYQMDSAEVFAIPSCIIVSFTTPDGKPVTRMRRIQNHGTDLELLESCNDLCRRLCAETPPLNDAYDRLMTLPWETPRFSSSLVLLGYGLAPAFFALLFGGGLTDAVGALLVGLCVGITQLHGRKLLGSNNFFRTATSSTAASLVAFFLVRCGIGSDVDTVTISALMMLVPGVALTNAMREIMAGDTISSLSHAADAILIAVAIALGSAVGITFTRMVQGG